MGWESRNQNATGKVERLNAQNRAGKNTQKAIISKHGKCFGLNYLLQPHVIIPRNPAPVNFKGMTQIDRLIENGVGI